MNCSSKWSRRIASNYLLCGGELLRNPVVEVAAGGEIVSVTTDRDRSQESQNKMDCSILTEFYSGIMLAGFVNAHSHLELSYLRGAIEPRCGFAQFASKIGAVRSKFTDQQREEAILRGESEMLRGGVVAVADIVNGSTSYACKGEGRIEYRNFAELFGLRIEGLSVASSLLERGNTVATPHSLYSLNDRVIKEIVESTSADQPLSIHFMESESELQLFERRGALYEWYERAGFECDFLHYASPAERLVSLIPPTRSVMLVHNCCVRQSDIDLIMSHFTAPVYWVVCPRSNDYISGLRPPLELLRRNGLNIAVGTDSLASNWSLSMVEELRAMADVPLVERLDWATRGGAAALRLNHLGEVSIGRRPHINILSGIDYEKMQLTESSRIKRVL